VEQTNYQELNRKMFSDHIADPSVISSADSQTLENLINKFPYSQLLHSFYTRSLLEADPAIFEKALAKAALYSPDRNVLRIIIEDADLLNLENIKQSEVVQTQKESGILVETDLINSEDIDYLTDENSDNLSVKEDKEYSVQIIDAVNQDPEEEQNLSFNETETAYDEPVTYDEHIADPDLAEVENPSAEKQDAHGDIVQPILRDNTLSNEEVNPLKEVVLDVEDELDILIKQNAVPSDYLKKEESENLFINDSESLFKPEIETLENISQDSKLEEQNKVSNYNDDKLPYSFLWWLSKARLEHSGNYQPYVSFKLDTSLSIKRNAVDQLSSQIIENIFHLQSPVDQLENAPKTIPFKVKRKEDYILEKFIREEPQISAPNSEKLDTENKARKSAEDFNDLVSETLAQIYTDQMLFHKALGTYKKLSLKFPEKSTYFADRIRELEKKIN
jgi:hypothetical protein